VNKKQGRGRIKVESLPNNTKTIDRDRASSKLSRRPLIDTKPQPPEKPWKVDRKTRRAIVCLRFLL